MASLLHSPISSRSADLCGVVLFTTTHEREQRPIAAVLHNGTVMMGVAPGAVHGRSSQHQGSPRS